MAATASEAFWIAQQTGMVRRIKFLAMKAAVAVMSEEATTANHAERVVYAKTILDGSYSSTGLALACMVNSTVQAGADASDPPTFGVSDSDLEFTVNSVFDAMAGVATQ